MATLSSLDLYCNFCGKGRKEIRRMIAGPDVYICDECVALCKEIISDGLDALNSVGGVRRIPEPIAIKRVLDDYVIGQEHAKKVLAVAVHNHYKRISQTAKDEIEIDLQKSNILLLGPTGSGKTLLAQTLARILQVPFSITDATSLTQAGYVGEDVESIVSSLLISASYDVEKAQMGIAYIDEIDKLSRRSEHTSPARDVSGEGVQQALLKLLEGTTASCSPKGGKKHPQQEFTQVRTHNILFICGGAFPGLADIIRARVDDSYMGFGVDVKSKLKDSNDLLLSKVTVSDLIKFGLIPELLGRLPILVSLDEPNEATLGEILTRPKNALIRQYKKLFSFERAELVFTEAALAAIAREALERKTGARGLKTILEDVMLETMFVLPDIDDIERIIVEEETVRQRRKPLYIFRESERLLKAQ